MDNEWSHKLRKMSSAAPPPIEFIRQFPSRHDRCRGLQSRARVADQTLLPRSDPPTCPTLLRRFGNQNFSFGGMPFRHLREILPHRHAAGPDQLFCDAGAGYGHVVFTAQCVARCRFRAIEILPVRYNAMIRTGHRLGFEDIEIVRGDAPGAKLRRRGLSVLNNPFFRIWQKRFIDRLTAARQRPLTVIAMHNIVDVLRGNAAFAEIEKQRRYSKLLFGVFVLKQPDDTALA